MKYRDAKALPMAMDADYPDGTMLTLKKGVLTVAQEGDDPVGLFFGGMLVPRVPLKDDDFVALVEVKDKGGMMSTPKAQTLVVFDKIGKLMDENYYPDYGFHKPDDLLFDIAELIAPYYRTQKYINSHDGEN